MSAFQERIENLSPQQRQLLALLVNDYLAQPENHDVLKTPQAPKQIVGYVVSQSGQPPTPVELRRFLNQTMPDYMVPSRFVSLPSLPLTPNGKVDRQALPAPTEPVIDGQKNIVSPRDALELTILGIWKNSLNIPFLNLSVVDNFFDLGGNSLSAMQMMAEVQLMFDKDFPPSQFLKRPTIEHLATIVRADRDDRDWSPLVPVKPNGAKPPFFIAYPAGGNPFGLSNIVDHLDEDQPFYVLQASVLDSTVDAERQIHNLATKFIDEIRKVQPEGPYLLGGYCMGALIAFEMASLLQQKSEAISIVVLIDPPVLTNLQTTKIRAINFVEELRPKVGSVKRKFLRRLRQFGNRTSHLSEQSESNSEKNHSPWWALAKQANVVAMEKYTPHPYLGRTALLIAEIGVKTAKQQAWETVARGGLDIYLLPGNHNDIARKRQAPKIARILQSCLDGANQPGLPGSEANKTETSSQHTD